MKVAFVSIIGRPNVGKSTLLNNIIDYDLSIVTPTPNTTRDKILGIFNSQDYQIIFTDTPGIHKPKSELGESLNNNAFEAIKESDLLLFLQPSNEEILKGDLFIIEKIKEVKNKVAVLTKIDKLNSKDEVNDKIKYFKSNGFDAVIGVSEKIPASIETLMEEIKKFSYESLPFYNEDDITDKSILFLAKEEIRSVIINNLYDELPHSVAVEIDGFVESEEKIVINATIFVQKESQKGILIGKNGSMISKIGKKARYNITQKLNKKIDLYTKVKVLKNWQNDSKMIKRFNY